VSDKDQQFLQHAASDGLAEVQMGQMAAERATNPEVRRFGQQMVTDHEKAVQLFSTAAKEGQDADIKAFANKTLPTLQEHLHIAWQLTQQQGSMSQAR